MPTVIDTATKNPWPKPWPTLKLKQIKAECLASLKKRDVGRGIPQSGQVYTTATEGEGKTAHEVSTIDPVLAAKRHCYQDARKMYESRWYEFCHEPRSLADFQAEIGKPDAAALKAKQEAAKDVEESLNEEPTHVLKPKKPKAATKPKEPAMAKGGD